MHPLETYMRAMRPFMLPGILIIESYADFLKEVGKGRYWQQSSPQPSSSDPFAESKPRGAALHPAPAAFDPFASWRNLSAFMPAVNGLTASGLPESSDERGHDDVASDNDAVTPAKTLLHELAVEAERIRLELAEIDARDQAHAERHALDHSDPDRKSGGLTHEAAQKRAKKAWRTRRANAADEAERKAARRKARSRMGSRPVTNRTARA